MALDLRPAEPRLGAIERAGVTASSTARAL
jgi:hypothetical protein